MTQGPGTSASNDFRPFKDYTDLKDTLNPLSPNSVQNQFSPNDIHTLSTDKL